MIDKNTVDGPETQNDNITHSLNVISAEPIKITDEKSAIERVRQWALQKDQIEKIGTAFNVFKFYHRMSLMDIYDEIKIIAKLNFPNQKDKQRVFEREIICNQEGISIRSERRFKVSAMRLRIITDTGISFIQIIKAGMHISDFEASIKLYEKFTEALDIASIENLNEEASQQLNTKILFQKLSEYDMDLD